MAKKLLLPLVAVIIILAMIIPGCEPVVPEEPAGDPIEIIIIARSEDERQGMGEYLGDLLADLGFDVDVQVKTGAEAGPIWQVPSRAQAGDWHVYTGGWVYTLLPREEVADLIWFFGGIWNFSSLALREPVPELYDACDALYSGDFADLDERKELVETALQLGSEDSLIVYAVDTAGFNAYNKGINTAACLAAGIYGARLWGLTTHFHEDFEPQAPTGTTELQVGTVSIMPSPWNPIDGSNWVYDQMPIRATGDAALYPHPELGYWLPQRLASATVTVLDTLPVAAPNAEHVAPYLTLNRVEEITVPDDAWASWNTTSKQWITAAERVADAEDDYTATAIRKSTVVYETDLFSNNKWHDGSDVSPADFLMAMILDFERGMPGGAIYDEGFAEDFDAWFGTFKGMEITDTAPLTIDYYSTYWTLDPDGSVTAYYPFYSRGPAGWHNLMPAIMAEMDDKLAFGEDKADLSETAIWTNFAYGDISDPESSLGIMSDYLADLEPVEGDATAFPYYAFFDYWYGELGYAGDDMATEAATRFGNLDTWVTDKEHFWVGTGPFYLEEANYTAKSVTLKKSPYFFDDGGKWLDYCVDEPVSVPVHTGAWVDQIVMREETEASLALGEMNATPPTMHVYAFSVSDAELYDALLDGDYPNVAWTISYGSWSEFLLNPVLFPENDTLNPFGLVEVREAIQWLIDRDTIADEIYGGMAAPKYTILGGAFPEAVERYPDLIAAIELEYENNPTFAASQIETALEALADDYPGLWWNEAQSKWYWDPAF